MPSQFIRLNCYGERPNARSKPHENAYDIIDEAARVAGSAPHIAEPRPPNVLYGVPLGSVQAKVAKLARIARDRRGARLRRDGTVLYAVVVSYPVAWRHLGCERQRTTYKQWLDAVVEWLRSEFGESLQSVVEHIDERRPHVHAFVIPPLCPRNRINHRLHPGHTAREAAFANGADHVAGERSYRVGMRVWQDAFHEAVSSRFGHERVGPKRKRFQRDVALIRQASDRLLERVDTILTSLFDQLEANSLVTKSEELAEIEVIAELVRSARGRLLAGRSDAMETLEAALTGLVEKGEMDSDDGGENPVTDGMFGPARHDWGHDEDPRPDEVGIVEPNDDPDAAPQEDRDLDGDWDADCDDDEELSHPDWSEEMDSGN